MSSRITHTGPVPRTQEREHATRHHGHAGEGEAQIMPAYQEGQVIQVTTVDVAHGGWCVARPDDGPVVFVRHALPGETVRAQITDVTSRLARAEEIGRAHV